MSRRVCKACGKEYLSGYRALVLGPRGNAYSIVCHTCSRKGALVVPVVQPTIVRNVEASSTDLKEGIRRLESFLKASKLVEPAKSDFGKGYMQGKIEAYESAIEVLRKIGAPS